MFRRLAEVRDGVVHFTVDGKPAQGRLGDTVAAALLATGIVTFRRSAVSGAPRAPYCLMGSCFECLVTIDGIGNCQSCLIPIYEDMAVETGKGRRDIGSETAR